MHSFGVSPGIHAGHSGAGDSLNDAGTLVLFRSAIVTSGPSFVVHVALNVIDILMMSSCFYFCMFFYLLITCRW